MVHVISDMLYLSNIRYWGSSFVAGAKNEFNVMMSAIIDNILLVFGPNNVILIAFCARAILYIPFFNINFA